MRKSLPWLSFLLLCVLVPVQAAGCCKWSALLGWNSGKAPTAVAAQDLSGGMAADHACCRKQEADPGTPASPATAAGDCAQGDKGCCLQGAPEPAPALVSVPVAFGDGLALILLLPTGESPRVASPLPEQTRPEESGPPLYLSHLRLLI